MRTIAILVSLVLAGCTTPTTEEKADIGKPLARVATTREVGVTGPYDVPGAHEAAEKAGITWVRIPFAWIHIEGVKGEYNWDWPYGPEKLSARQRITEARAHGFRIFVALVGTPAWASDQGNYPSPPSDPAYFRNFAAAAAREFGEHVGAWGLWNEPNYCGPDVCYWSGTPWQYRRLILEPGFDGIKSVDPTAVVVAPNTLHKDGDLDIVRWIAADGAWVRPLDVVGVHAYGTRGQQVEWVNRFAAWCRDRPKCNGFWLTEFGFSRTAPLAPDPEPGVALMTVLNRCQSTHVCQKAFIYSLGGGEEDFGLLDRTGAPKARLGVLTKWIKGG